MLIREWCDKKCEQIEHDTSLLFKNKDIKKMNIYPIISDILSGEDTMASLKNRVFDDADDLEYCFIRFRKIMADINYNVVYVPSQQSFCMFMGWTDRFYKKMLNNSTDSIGSIMQLIQEYLLECQVSAGQSGVLRQNITKFRSQLAGDHGLNLVTQKEKMVDDRVKKQPTKEELQKQLLEMGAKVPSQINQKKKKK